MDHGQPEPASSKGSESVQSVPEPETTSQTSSPSSPTTKSLHPVSLVPLPVETVPTESVQPLQDSPEDNPENDPDSLLEKETRPRPINLAVSWTMDASDSLGSSDSNRTEIEPEAGLESSNQQEPSECPSSGEEVEISDSSEIPPPVDLGLGDRRSFAGPSIAIHQQEDDDDEEGVLVIDQEESDDEPQQDEEVSAMDQETSDDEPPVEETMRQPEESRTDQKLRALMAVKRLLPIEPRPLEQPSSSKSSSSSKVVRKGVQVDKTPANVVQDDDDEVPRFASNVSVRKRSGKRPKTVPDRGEGVRKFFFIKSISRVVTFNFLSTF